MSSEEVSNRERLSSYVRGVLGRYRRGEQEGLSKRERWMAAPLQILALTVREVARDGIIQRASSLTFFTMLSVVPLLSVVTALLGAFGVFDPVEGDLARYLRTLFPAAGGEIAGYLQASSTRAASSIGGINGVGLLVISIFLFNAIERSLTDIWHGAHNRSLMAKFLMFYTLITLGPLLLIVSVVQTASAQLVVSSYLGVDFGVVSQFYPALAGLVVFTLMNKILPSAQVSWRSALLAGVVTAAGFELAKWGFNQYVNVVITDSYNRLYGALGTVPIFMLWVYVTWIVILVGSEIAYCYQHMERLVRLDTPLEQTLWEGKHRLRRVYDTTVCLEVLAPVAIAYQGGQGAIDEESLAMMAGLDVGVAREVLERLISERVVSVSGKARGGARQFLPARPLDDIELGPIVEQFWRHDTLTGSQQLAQLRQRHHDDLMGLLEGHTARDLAGAQGLDQLREVLEGSSTAELDEDELEASFEGI